MIGNCTLPTFIIKIFFVNTLLEKYTTTAKATDL